jgi:hypothetical protein
MENLIKPLQQWAMENEQERGVLVIAADKKESHCGINGTIFNVAKAITVQASKNPEVYHILLMGLFAATKNNRFLSLRARLVAWLLK